MPPKKNVNKGTNGTQPVSKKIQPKPKKYGVGTLPLGVNSVPLEVTVMTAPSPSKIDTSTHKYILRDRIGKREIVAFACGPPRLQFNQILQVNASYEIQPGCARAAEKERNPKFKSEVRNSKILFLNIPSKIKPLEENHASSQSPGTSSNARRNSNSSPSASAPATNLDNGFQNYLQELEKQKGFRIRTFTDVQILGGSVRRYIGCENCTKSIQSSEGGKYFCEKKCKKPKKPVNPKICYIIKDIKIKHSETQFPYELVCFNENAKIILGKEAFEFVHDLEAQNVFERNIAKSLYTLVLKGKLKEGVPPYPNIVIQSADPKEIFIATASTDGVSGTDSRILCQPENSGFNYMNFAKEFKVLVNKDTSLRPAIGYNEQRYELNSTPPGHALIINNVNFPDKGDIRLGAVEDLKRMKDLLSQLNYKVHVKEDVKSTNLQSIIQDFQSELRRGDVSSSFVVVMSHGTSNEIFMSDGIMVNAYSDIVYKFSTKFFPEFEGKPKIFVFQSCQNFGPRFSQNTFEQLSLSDILVVWPTSPGFPAPRHEDVGSPFIIYFAKILMEQACNTDLEKMCKNVQEAFRGGGPIKDEFLQLPHYMSFLFNNNFYFNMD